MTVRVLHVSQPVDAGVAVVLADLAEHQVAHGWEVHLACPPTGWLMDRLGGGPVHLHAWSAGRSPGPQVPGEVRALSSVVSAIGPDVVHLHSAKAGLAGRLAVRGRVPTVFQPHAWSFHAAGGAVRRLSTTWERSAVRWTDLLITVSDGELREGLRRGISPARSAVIPNGVDTERFMPRDRATARARLGLTDAPLALLMGRLARQKGQDLAFAAWESVHAVLPGASLAVVGDGPERAALARSAPAGVTLHGPTADPQDWYAAADVVLLPSRWEGMALVPLEAMACGRPVVGFDVAGVAESIGDAGAAVPRLDVAAFADAVVARLADRRLADDEGRRGRARAVELFDLRQAVALTTKATSELVPRHTHR